MWRPEVLRLLLQHGGNTKAWETQTKVGHLPGQGRETGSAVQ